MQGFCKQYVLMSSVITVITWLHPHPGIRIPISLKSPGPDLFEHLTSYGKGVSLRPGCLEQILEEKNDNKSERQLDDAANFGCQVGSNFIEILQSKVWRRWLYVLLFNRGRGSNSFFFPFLSPKSVKGKGKLELNDLIRRIGLIVNAVRMLSFLLWGVLFEIRETPKSRVGSFIKGNQ